MTNIIDKLISYDKCKTILVDAKEFSMISIRLNEKLEKELKDAAKFEGLSVSDYVRNIIVEKLEDLYDYKIAEKAHNEFINDNKKTYTFDETFDS